MFALARTAGDLVSFEFGVPVDPPLPLEEKVRWIMADYENRRDEFMDISISQSVALLVGRLLEALEEPARMVPIIRALGFLRSPNSAAQLAALLTYPSRDVQCEVISSLGRIGSLEELRSIEPFLTSPDRELRRAAIVALGRSPDPAVIARLYEAAGDDPDLRALAQQGRRRLDAFEARNDRAYVEAIVESEEYEDQIRLMETTAAYVLHILADRTRRPVVRARSARLIGLVRMRRAANLLADILNDPSEPPEVLLAVVIAAGRCKARAALPSLVRVLNDPDPVFEEPAITALGEIGAKEALEPLLVKWDDRNLSLRQRLLSALSRLALISGTDLLRTLLSENRPWSPDLICFIDDNFQTSRRYSPGLLDSALHSPHVNTRRDAILLMAFLAGDEELPKLRQLAETESNPENRGLAGLALRRMA